ncbi:MAG: GNAT family N-acetyltransferase [Crocinitomicaceae bacterium]
MKIHRSATLSAKHDAEINALWNTEYPQKLTDRFALLLVDTTLVIHFYVLNHQDEIIAWSVLFEKDNDLRFSIIVSSNYKQKGLGTALLTEMKKEGRAFSGWVIDHNHDHKANGSNYLSPLSFYVKNGFTIDQSMRLDNEIIKAVLVRTNH